MLKCLSTWKGDAPTLKPNKLSNSSNNWDRQYDMSELKFHPSILYHHLSFEGSQGRCSLSQLTFWAFPLALLAKPYRTDFFFHYQFNRTKGALTRAQVDYLRGRAKASPYLTAVMSRRPQLTHGDPHSPPQKGLCCDTQLMTGKKKTFLNICLILPFHHVHFAL